MMNSGNDIDPVTEREAQLQRSTTAASSNTGRSHLRNKHDSRGQFHSKKIFALLNMKPAGVHWLCAAGASVGEARGVRGLHYGGRCGATYISLLVLFTLGVFSFHLDAATT
jgi:hypothetical protein